MEEDECNFSDSQNDESEMDILDANCDYPEEISDDNIEDDSEEDENDLTEDDTNNFESFKVVSNTELYLDYENKNRVTKPILTKFEVTRILGLRAQQIEMGNQPLIEIPNNIIDSKNIAELEYEKGVIPFIIRRFLPDGKYEDWKLEDFN